MINNQQRKTIIRVARKWVGDEAPDIVQQVCTELPHIDYSLLVLAVKHRAFNFLRDEATRRRLRMSYYASNSLDHDYIPPPDHALRITLQTYVNNLSSDRSALFQLQVQGYTQQEMSLRLGKSQAWVSFHLTRIRKEITMLLKN